MVKKSKKSKKFFCTAIDNAQNKCYNAYINKKEDGSYEKSALYLNGVDRCILFGRL